MVVMVRWILMSNDGTVKDMVQIVLDLLDRRFKIVDALPTLPFAPFFILQNNVALDKTFRDLKKHAKNAGHRIPRGLNDKFKKGGEIPVFFPFCRKDEDGNIMFEFFAIHVKTIHHDEENVTYIRGFQNLVAAMMMFLSDAGVDVGIKDGDDKKWIWEASETIIGQFMIENRGAVHGGAMGKSLTEKQKTNVDSHIKRIR